MTWRQRTRAPAHMSAPAPPKYRSSLDFLAAAASCERNDEEDVDTAAIRDMNCGARNRRVNVSKMCLGVGGCEWGCWRASFAGFGEEISSSADWLPACLFGNRVLRLEWRWVPECYALGDRFGSWGLVEIPSCVLTNFWPINYHILFEEYCFLGYDDIFVFVSV